MGEAAVLGGNEMADEGEGVLQLGYDGIFIVLVGQVVAGGDVGTAHADAIECQGEDVATLAESDCKLTIENRLRAGLDRSRDWHRGCLSS